MTIYRVIFIIKRQNKKVDSITRRLVDCHHIIV